MIELSRRLAVALAAATACLLAACAAPGDTAAKPATPAPAPAPAAADRDTLTGSRLPSKTTDRLLRSVGASGAKEMERDRPPDPGPRSN